MAEKRLADVVANWYWDDRHKRWTITVSYRDGRMWKRAETSAPMDQVNVSHLLDALVREMESWLPLQG